MQSWCGQYSARLTPSPEHDHSWLLTLFYHNCPSLWTPTSHLLFTPSSSVEHTILAKTSLDSLCLNCAVLQMCHESSFLNHSCETPDQTPAYSRSFEPSTPISQYHLHAPHIAIFIHRPHSPASPTVHPGVAWGSSTCCQPQSLASLFLCWWD